MATFTNNFYGGGKGYNLCLDITTNSQSVANNTSNVTVTVRLVSLGSSYTISSSVSKNGTLTINGTSYYFTFTAGLTGNQNKTLFTKTVDVSHSSDGTKTLSVSATCGINVTLSGTYYGNVTVNGSTALTTIPRTTPVSISGSGTFGSEKWIGHSRASTAFTVTLRYSCGTTSGTIISKSATNETYWTPPKSLQSQIPKATNITITVYCDTYSGNTLIGTTSTSFVCYIASDCVPTINGCKFMNGENYGTVYYQGVSTVRMEADVSGTYGSTITKYEYTIDGKTKTNYGYIMYTDIVYTSGYRDITMTITDSRGKTATKTFSGYVYFTAYTKPQITNFTCKRMGYDENDNLVISNLGAVGYFTASGTFHSDSTSQSRKFMYKPATSSSWTTIVLSNTNYTDYQFSTSLAAGSAYDLKFVMTDNVTSVEMQIKMQNIYPLINMNSTGTAIAFGKECNADNRFMVEMDASFNKWVGIYSLQVTGNSLFQGNMCLSGTGWLMADKMSYYTSGGWVNDSGSQTWGVACANHFLPTTTTRYLGTSAHRWEALYCVSSPNVSSDARNKENVKYMYNQPEVINEYTDVKENDEITTRDLLDFVLNDLYMVTFDYKQSTEDMEEGEIEMVTAMNNRQIGFIAQDIADTKVGKYLVTKDKEGVLSYESSNWPSIIAGALQQEIRDRQSADKELMNMLNDIINE